MEKADARKSPAGLYERRKQVIRLYRDGYRPGRISELSGLSRGSVNTAINLYKEDGVSSLKPRTRGRRTGMCRRLDAEQEKRLQQLICEKRPEQLKMDFALWTRAAVRELRSGTSSDSIYPSDPSENICVAGVSRRKSPSSALMNGSPWLCANGWMNNIRPSKSGPLRRAPKSIGKTRRPS
ncbi:MAG: helix-turn-helix domain-containing protein [Pontiellaceae bacterium]|nr:helix-turn-helix domain-containing protein [Pontiellaceae bacterium]MBN2786000.1 helix-turn-helix domain-containing protein [Pontiellaceae bacterium]